MKLTFETNLQKCSRAQIKRFVQKFGTQFTELLEECNESISRTFDREDSYFGSLPYFQMGEQRESIYLCYALIMQGIDRHTAMVESDPEYRVYLRGYYSR